MSLLVWLAWSHIPSRGIGYDVTICLVPCSFYGGCGPWRGQGVHQKATRQGSHSDWKTWKNGKAFSSQGILNRLEKSGKSQGKSHKILEN